MLSRLANVVLITVPGMGNTKTVIKTRVKRLIKLPPLAHSGLGRVITKHYTNLVFSMPADQYAFLSFLLSRCGSDNTFKYSTVLLRQYKIVCEALNKPSDIKRLKTSPQVCRRIIKGLIEQGHVLTTRRKNTFMVNPLYTIKMPVSARFYDSWIQAYNKVREDLDLNDQILDLTDRYINGISP